MGVHAHPPFTHSNCTSVHYTNQACSVQFRGNPPGIEQVLFLDFASPFDHDEIGLDDGPRLALCLPHLPACLPLTEGLLDAAYRVLRCHCIVTRATARLG